MHVWFYDFVLIGTWRRRRPGCKIVNVSDSAFHPVTGAKSSAGRR